MVQSSLTTIEEVVEACRANATEVGAAFGRGLDLPVTVAVGAPVAPETAEVTKSISSPGLAIVLVAEEQAGAMLVPESSGLLPPWCAAPDATGQSKLSTLAQELGMLLFPPQLAVNDFRAACVKDLAGAMARGIPDQDAKAIPLELSLSSTSKGVVYFVWPLAKPAAVLGAGSPPAKTQPAAASMTDTSHKAPSVRPAGPKKSVPATPGSLPEYAKSLLRIRVPVVVALAQKKHLLSRIVELGPGSIIQFDKSCEETLELQVGSLPVAQGEAVKVGDKFGLRITSMILPEERFQSIQPARLSAPPRNR